ncbi:hypothetical protein B0H11DRAFT_2235344 [Mycena galericulata]|nr:hypothetical protein B0H11DRAFT_2235344 [Mycena galericulata]
MLVCIDTRLINAVLPHVVDSDDSAKFFKQVLGVDVLDALRKFEQYSCTLDDGEKDRNDIASVRKQIVMLILEGLRKLKRSKTACMNYVQYDLDVRHKLGIELSGWPGSIEMQRPALLRADDARTIRDMLRSGAIHWTPLTKSQKEDLAEELAEAREDGPLRQRKERSDRGKPRGPRTKKGAASDGEEDEEEDEEQEQDQDQEEEEEEELTPSTATTTLAVAAAPPASTLPSTAALTPSVPAPSAAALAGVAAPNLDWDAVDWNLLPGLDFSQIPDVDFSGIPAAEFDALVAGLDFPPPDAPPTQYPGTLSAPNLLPHHTGGDVDFPAAISALAVRATGPVSSSTAVPAPATGLTPATLPALNSAANVAQTKQAKRKATAAADAGRAPKKARPTAQSAAAPGGKKERKKRSDAGVRRTQLGGDENSGVGSDAAAGSSGASAKKPRKKRSDAGVLRGPRA